MRYALMREMDVSNGIGLGVSLFVQGCPYHCYKCFNPETWNFDDGKPWTRETEEQFMELIDKPFIRRVSILGGEPLCNDNIVDVYIILKKIRKRFPDKKIWLYTGGILEATDFESYNISDTEDRKWLAPQPILRITVTKCDYVVDGPYIDSKRDLTLAFRGSSNQRIIDVKKTLAKKEIVTYDG